MTNTLTTRHILQLTAELTAAYSQANSVDSGDLPALIEIIYQSLVAAEHVKPAPASLTPAVPVKKSVFPDFIICLEDGRRVTLLRPYLKTRFNMTAEDYRARWGLLDDYPFVAPSYAAARSALAHRIGLGRKPTPVPPPAPVKTAKRAKGVKPLSLDVNEIS